MSRVALREVGSAQNYGRALASGLAFVGDRPFRRGDRVYLKPNLISERHQAGVTTSPALLKALVEWLDDHGAKITICESSGWLNRWTANAAFIGHGIDVLARAHGVKLLDLDCVSRRSVVVDAGGVRLQLRLPDPLLHECDGLISVPVVKTHIFTTISIGMKNLYGCLPHPDRLLMHPQLARTIVALSKVLKPKLSVVDGLFGMTGPGPTYGDIQPLNLLAVSDNPAAGDEVLCRAINIEPATVEHLALARAEGLCHVEPDVSTTVPIPVASFIMTRGPRSMVSVMASRSRLLTRLLYLSPLAAFKDVAVRIVKR